MGNTKFQKLTKAELISLLELRNNLLKKKENECAEHIKTNNIIANDLQEANKQIECLNNSIDYLTSDKYDAIEDANDFKREAKRAKLVAGICFGVAVVAILIAIIF